MGFVDFVKSAKRFKRERKKPRKRKLELKIAKLEVKTLHQNPYKTNPCKPVRAHGMATEFGFRCVVW
eukprot:COSAG05_NODE_153_length_15894_cov_27.910415_5_plen_67_part_00